MTDRHDNAREIRRKAADLAHSRPYTKDHKNNEEEDSYKDKDGNRNFIGNFTKGLKHHPANHRDAGEVINEDYRKLTNAIRSQKREDFDKIPLGMEENNSTKFKNPRAGFVFDLEGSDAQDFKIRVAPKLDSIEAAGEVAELYWMALSRDIPFTEFSSNSLIGEAVSDLSIHFEKSFPVAPEDFKKVTITHNTIFRGMTDGDLKGGYISQFLLQDIHWGPQLLEQKQRPLKNTDYLTDYTTWLEIQDGKIQPMNIEYLHDSNEDEKKINRYIWTPRDLTYYVHVDQLYQAYLGACLILLDGGYKFDKDMPYQQNQPSKTQEGFGTFGGPNIITLVTEVATRALKAVWYQKWGVHRRLRPEAFGGLIHRQRNTDPTLTKPDPAYPIDNKLLNSIAVNKVFEKYHSYLLPQAFREGSPTHPSYGAGHATVAGACTTILKAWFDESEKMHKIAKVEEKGNTLVVEESNPEDLTVGGELNKVAANIAIGRNWGGVHYRSDYTSSLLLGEELAIGILKEQSLCYQKDEPFKCSLTKFNGDTIPIE